MKRSYVSPPVPAAINSTTTLGRQRGQRQAVRLSGVLGSTLAWDAAGRIGGSAVRLGLYADGGVGTASTFVQHTGSSTRPRQGERNAHAVSLSPNKRFLLVLDLRLD